MREPEEDPLLIEMPSGTRSGYSTFVIARHRGGATEMGQLFVRPDGLVAFRGHTPPGAAPKERNHHDQDPS